MEPLSPLAKRLLDAARDAHDPTPGELAHTLDALHAHLAFPNLPDLPVEAPPAAAATATAATHAKLTAVASGKVIKLALASLALGGALTSVVLVSRGDRVVPTSVMQPAVPTQVREPQVEPLNLPTPSPSATPPARPSEARPARKAAPQSERELRMITQALAALRDGRPTQALSLLQQHEARFPQGQFVTERDGLRVLALCAAGRVEAGRRAREAFLQRAEHAPIAARVRLACQGTEGPR